MSRLVLVLGGARSGKSGEAERLVTAEAGPWAYLATAEALDKEMAERIALHRAQRGDGWQTHDTPLTLARTLDALPPGQPALVDCLTLWLTNLLFAGRGAAQAEAGEALDCPLLAGEIRALVDTLPQLPGRVILVSNEVGWGIVPMERLSRLFADEQGRLNQQVAAVCGRVTLVAAGLPLVLK